MPKVTEAYLEARKRQVIDAAASCFAQHGFHQTSMQDICKQAELSPGAVYRYFESKEDIIAAMVEERRREGIALVEAIAAEETDTLKALDQIARAFFSRLDDPEGCALDIELWAEAQANPRIREALRSDFVDVNDKLADLLRRAQDRGDLNARLDPEAVAWVMESFFHGLILQRAIDSSIDAMMAFSTLDTSASTWFDTVLRAVSTAWDWL